MARIVGRNHIFMIQSAITMSTAATVYLPAQFPNFIQPQTGARIREWGILTTTAGVGTGTATLTLVDASGAGTTTALADSIAYDYDAVAKVVTTAAGPGGKSVGSGNKAVATGAPLSIVQTVDTYQTTRAIATFFIDWIS